MAELGRPRTLDEAKAWMHDRSRAQVHPMGLISHADAGPVIDSLSGLDGARWAAAWGAAGLVARAEGDAAAAAGDDVGARAAYLKAHGFYFLGRFPCPNHPDKVACHVAERETYLLAGRSFEPPVQRVSIPFAGKPGEGSEVVVLYRRPADVERPPVVIMWGGVDAWKEQMTAACDLVLKQGLAVVAVDNVGTGESPVRGVADAERQFVTVLDWCEQQSDLAGARPGLLGRSFGGYWATKLAHQFPERIGAAVNWGGGAHFMFQRDWIEASRHPDSYLMELVETRMMMLGATTFEEYLVGFAALSLLDQGLLDRPCAPLLLVNGKDDRQCPVADVHLLTEYGSPKSVRMFPGGHMGLTPQTLPTIITWLVEQTRAAQR
jgi:esterase FrsA